jgi:hypothetical protein
VPPTPLTSHWNADLFERLSLSYPYARTREVALEAMRQQHDPYQGRRDTPKIPLRTRKISAHDSNVIREKFMEEVAKGDFEGPFSSPPFPNSCVIPNGTKRKHRYVPDDDPLASKIRITTDMSSTDHGGPSVNDLCTTPRWLTANFSASSLRDTLAWQGRGCRVTIRDIPNCFRTLKVPPHLLFLFVYKVITEEHGQEYFADKALPFGWAPSEYEWAGCGAIIDWALYWMSVHNQHRHVDNFFDILGPLPAHEALLLSQHTDRCFAELGVPLHEQEDAVNAFTGLGWEWTTDNPTGLWPMTMTMPLDKYSFYSSQIKTCLSAPSLSTKQISSICGILQFTSAGLPAVRAYVAPMLALSDYLKHSRPTHAPPTPTPPIATEALSAVHQFLDNWDRHCPIVAGFGPCFQAEFRGWTDGCTTMSDDQPVPCVGGAFFDPNTPHSPLEAFIHRLTPDESQEARRALRASVPWIEVLSAVLWVERYGHLCRCARVLLATDSDTGALVLQRMFSTEPHLMTLIRRFRLAIATHFITIRVRSIVGSHANPLADALSHNLPQASSQLAWRLFGRPINIETF